MLRFIKIVILLIFLLAVGISAKNYVLNPVSISQKNTVTISVPENVSVLRMGEILQAAGIIRNKYVFKYYVRWENVGAKLQAGDYEFSPSMSLPEIVNMLKKGEKKRFIVTIPEGFTVKQIAQLLSDKGFVNYDKFMELTQHKTFPFPFLNYNNKLTNPLEGYLFPDTYFIPRDFGEDKIILMMLKHFNEIFDAKMRLQAQKLSLTIPQAVTVASLVEREAKLSEERPLIAGIFYSRLHKNMRLESCATVQYLLGKPKPVLLYEDLKIDSPYNTYRNEGLPPGPIANPGKASLIAALNPQKTSYLYFVAKNDGSHYFSKTLSEHDKAKRKYQK